jgi:hypothetical protein
MTVDHRKGAAMDEEIVPLATVADRLGLTLRTVYTREWRARVQLPAVRLPGPRGRILGVRASDLAAVMKRETFASGPEAA